MLEIRLRLILNCAATAIMFWFWVGSAYAGAFMFVLMGFVLSVIDYVFIKLKTGE